MRQRPHLGSDHQPRRVAHAAVAALAFCVVAGACGGGAASQKGTKELVLVVNAPFSKAPYVARSIEHGVELAVQTDADNGVFETGENRYRLKVVKLDNELSPRQALRNVRRAVGERAVAVVDEGTGVDASWQVANDAHLPLAVVYQGGLGLVEPEARPNVFRIAPTDRGVAYRLAEYLVPKKLRIALMYDDAGYGRQGKLALDKAFALNPESVAARIVVPAGQPDLSPQVLRAKRAGATALLVWARGTSIAAVLSAARSRGWDVPVYTPPAGSDPVVRQQLADHPAWVDGLTFASGRMTAEEGPLPFEAFQSAYNDAFGADEVGVKTADGRPVTQPPEYAMYAYDMVRAIFAALRAAGGAEDRARLVEALGSSVRVEGANGDARSFNRHSHEGVIDDDVYFARFRDMTFAPVRDDPLSSSLPVVAQTG
jgi:ABC-type branched-subunit amino acid transport system substrate-binding protein